MTKNTKYRKFVRFIWIAFSAGTLGVIGVFGAASSGLLGTMPDFRQLENPKTNLATQIISADNTVLGKFYLTTTAHPFHMTKFQAA
jgi:penicillin-binding protein 1A